MEPSQTGQVSQVEGLANAKAWGHQIAQPGEGRIGYWQIWVEEGVDGVSAGKEEAVAGWGGAGEWGAVASAPGRFVAVFGTSWCFTPQAGAVVGGKNLLPQMPPPMPPLLALGRIIYFNNSGGWRLGAPSFCQLAQAAHKRAHRGAHRGALGSRRAAGLGGSRPWPWAPRA